MGLYVYIAHSVGLFATIEGCVAWYNPSGHCRVSGLVDGVFENCKGLIFDDLFIGRAKTRLCIEVATPKKYDR